MYNEKFKFPLLSKELEYLRVRDMINYGVSWIRYELNEESGEYEAIHIPHNNITGRPADEQ